MIFESATHSHPRLFTSDHEVVAGPVHSQLEGVSDIPAVDGDGEERVGGRGGRGGEGGGHTGRQQQQRGEQHGAHCGTERKT